MTLGRHTPTTEQVIRAIVNKKGKLSMKNNKQDRRSQRTRQAISDALVALMLEKNYDAITVQEIIDRANVGRSTFYSHYVDKDDLLTSQFERIGQQLEITSNRDYALLPIMEFFEHAQENHRLFKSLIWGSGTDFIARAMHEHMNIHFEKLLQQKMQDQGRLALIKLVAHHITRTMLTLLHWWLDQKMPFSPEEMDTYFHTLVVPGVEQTLNIQLQPNVMVS